MIIYCIINLIWFPYTFNSYFNPFFTFNHLGCIGCPDWNRCCARDVFGSCVECPSWNKCCYKSGDPVCVAKNHGCTYIRRVADGNLEDARVYNLIYRCYRSSRYLNIVVSYKNASNRIRCIQPPWRVKLAEKLFSVILSNLGLVVQIRVTISRV